MTLNGPYPWYLLWHTTDLYKSNLPYKMITTSSGEDENIGDSFVGDILLVWSSAPARHSSGEERDGLPVQDM